MSQSLPEASTPEGAIEAAKNTLGADVPFSVRKIRTGGVLGFFATERYVAAPDEPVGDTGPQAATDRSRPASGGDPLDAALNDLSDLFSPEDLSTAAVYEVPAPVRADATSKRPQGSAGTAPRGSTVSRLPASALSASAVAMPMSKSSALPSAPIADADVSPAHPASPFASALARMEADAGVANAVQSAVGPSFGGQTSSRAAAPVAGAGRALRKAAVLSAALISDRGEAPTPHAVLTAVNEPAPAEGVVGSSLMDRLAAMGLPAGFVPDGFENEVADCGLHAALTRLIRMRLPLPPTLPTEPGNVVVVGPDAEALSAATQVASVLRADSGSIRWAALPVLDALVPAARRIKTTKDASAWVSQPRRVGATNIVAASAPISGSGSAWIHELVRAMEPTLVLAVVDATRKAGDVRRWLSGLPAAHGVLLQNTTVTGDPATFLLPDPAPVVLMDGEPASAARWASVLCERLAEGA